jgi:hypothetical protein
MPATLLEHSGEHSPVTPFRAPDQYEGWCEWAHSPEGRAELERQSS